MRSSSCHVCSFVFMGNHSLIVCSQCPISRTQPSAVTEPASSLDKELYPLVRAHTVYSCTFQSHGGGTPDAESSDRELDFSRKYSRCVDRGRYAYVGFSLKRASIGGRKTFRSHVSARLLNAEHRSPNGATRRPASPDRADSGRPRVPTPRLAQPS